MRSEDKASLEVTMGQLVIVGAAPVVRRGVGDGVASTICGVRVRCQLQKSNGWMVNPRQGLEASPFYPSILSSPIFSFSRRSAFERSGASLVEGR